ncbi:unnamed protein product [Paramecium primaurelia]|uniref:GPI mannosyltransferase 2 n=1 Tax=Paramecium primaurelia TaxID=5886 RepID=A0A8S1PUE6_PARPR|nr:unnamed protein product [Paramecium primaurelia]
MKLIYISLLTSILWHPICYLIDQMIEDYDKSTELVIDSHFLKHAIRWDSLFYIEIMENDYRYFKNHAFGYGIVLLGKVFSNSLIYLLILQKICNAISTQLIYKISMHYSNNNQKFSQLSALLFIFTPASVFFNSLYTESFFAFLVLVAIYLQIKQKTYQSSIVFALSIHLRSNGMFFIVYSGYPYLVKAIIQLKDKKFKQVIATIIEAIPIALIYLLSIGIMLYLPYKNYCQQNEMEWCKSIIPYAYGYIQKNFWDVSFLSSYKIRKLFFIYWGIQGILIQGFWLYKWMTKSCTIKNNIQGISIILPTIILFIITTFIAHINCSTRFFSTQIPFYWCLADLFYKKNGKINKWVLFYILEFNLGGLILFTNYLLWA